MSGSGTLKFCIENRYMEKEKVIARFAGKRVCTDHASRDRKKDLDED